MIDKPGLFPDMPIETYVGDPVAEPSLSSSVASLLISRSPAHARLAHPRLNEKRESRWSSAANFGSAIHAMVFGGQDIEVVDALTYQSNAAKEAKARILGQGNIPLLKEEHERAQPVAAAAHAALLAITDEPMLFEHTIVWQQSGAWLRCRPDTMTRDFRDIIDLKVTGTNARECNRQFFGQGYDMQAAFLEAGADTLSPATKGKRRIIYLFLESEPPFASSALLISEGTLVIARKKMTAAINLWKSCLETNTWPGYPSELIPSSRPSWDETSWLIREETDPSIQVEVAA